MKCQLLSWTLAFNFSFQRYANRRAREQDSTGHQGVNMLVLSLCLAYLHDEVPLCRSPAA